MSNKTLKQVLLEIDGLTAAEVDAMIADARDLVLNHGGDPEEVLREEFGLEPDYVFDLLDGCS